MIQIPKHVYRKFLRFALENANPFENRRTWKECIGLVIGRIADESLVVVTDIIPISSGTSVFVDITDYEKVFSLISPDRIDQGEVIVGWAHTHPGLGLFFSGTDIQTQLTYQKMHSQSFGLVLDPTQVSSHTPGFDIYRVDINTSHAYTVDYLLDEDFSFSHIHKQITAELYEVPLTEIRPIITGKHEITWKNIVLKVNIPSYIQADDFIQVKLTVELPYSQFTRLEYTSEVKVESSKSIHASEQKFHIFHETINSGTVALFCHQIQESESWHIILSNLKITDYHQVFVDLPDLEMLVKTTK